MGDTPTQAETDFVNEYTRALLVEWADYCARFGSLPSQPEPGLKMFPKYIAHAQEKGWVSRREPLVVLAKGYTTAAGYLRR